MEINGLQIPIAFVRHINEGKFRRERGSWQLKNDVDAYGNHLETEISVVCETSESVISETDVLWKYFICENLNDAPNEWENEPGFIPDITDYSRILWFAAGGDGSPFCFDFRDDNSNPNIIWWADAYWRRIAPDYNSFIELFDFSK